MAKGNKLGLIGRCLLGAGALVSTGCESYSEYDWLSLASKGAVGESKTPEQAAFFSLSSDHFATQADRYDTRQVVREGNAQGIETNHGQSINEGIKDSNPNLIPEYNLKEIKKKFNNEGGLPLFPGIKQIFTYTDYSDSNRNNLNDFEEYEGIKRNFNKREQIKVCLNYMTNSGKMKLFSTLPNLTKISIEVYTIRDGNKEIIFNDSYEENCKLARNRAWGIDIPRNLKSGIYVIRGCYEDQKGKKSSEEQTFNIL